MLSCRPSSIRPIAVLIAGLLASGRLAAQSCNGMPRHGGIAYEYGSVSAGDAPGVALGVPLGHVSFDGAFRKPDDGPDASQYEGDFRFSFLFGAGNVLLCPAVGIEYQHERWNASNDVVLTGQYAELGAGMGVGLEQPLGHGFAIIPFGGVSYRFHVSVFQLTAPNSDNSLQADSLSHTDFEYGALGRFRFLYAGFGVSRYSDQHTPYLTRLIFGLTFSSGIDKPKPPAKHR